MPLFDVAAAEAAELARFGWCGWRFGRCGWFCMDRVLVTWTFEAEHRRDGSGRSAGRPPITMSVGCGNISPRRLTKAMKFLWVVAFKLHAPLLCRRAPAWTGRRRSRRTRFRAAVVRYTEVCHARRRSTRTSLRDRRQPSSARALPGHRRRDSSPQTDLRR